MPVVPSYNQDTSYTQFANPHYKGPNNGVYTRFDFDVKGAGVANMQFPAFGFDEMVLSQFLEPLDLAQYGNLPGFDPSKMSGIGLQAFDVFSKDNPDLQAAREYNERLAKNKQRFDTFFTPQVLDIFKQKGIDVLNIKSREQLAAISPQAKGAPTLAVTDAVQRAGQEKNQRPKQGILDSVPGKLLLGAATLATGTVLGLGVVGTGALGGAVNSASQGGDLGDILKNAAIGGITAGALDKAGSFIQEKFGLSAPTPTPTTGSSSPPFDFRSLDGGLGGIGTVRPGDALNLDLIGKSTGIGFDISQGGSILPTFGNPASLNAGGAITVATDAIPEGGKVPVGTGEVVNQTVNSGGGLPLPLTGLPKATKKEVVIPDITQTLGNDVIPPGGIVPVGQTNTPTPRTPAKTSPQKPTTTKSKVIDHIVDGIKIGVIKNGKIQTSASNPRQPIDPRTGKPFDPNATIETQAPASNPPKLEKTETEAERNARLSQQGTQDSIAIARAKFEADNPQPTSNPQAPAPNPPSDTRGDTGTGGTNDGNGTNEGTNVGDILGDGNDGILDLEDLNFKLQDFINQFSVPTGGSPTVNVSSGGSGSGGLPISGPGQRNTIINPNFSFLNKPIDLGLPSLFNGSTTGRPSGTGSISPPRNFNAQARGVGLEAPSQARQSRKATLAGLI